MSPRTLRWIVVAVSIVGIVGMIVGSIADNNGTAITFGLITAVAVLGLILVTAVAGPDAFRRSSSVTPIDETQAAELETQMQALIDSGADEVAVRALVRSAVRLGRSGRH
jgi:hypothetical protein